MLGPVKMETSGLRTKGTGWGWTSYRGRTVFLARPNLSRKPRVGARGGSRRRGRRGRTARRGRRGRGRRGRRAPRRMVQNVGKLMMPSFKPPERLGMKLKAILDEPGFAINVNHNGSGTSGYNQVFTINNINTPWHNVKITAPQPHGLDLFYARYSKVRVRAVVTDIYLQARSGGSPGNGVFYAKMSDSATPISWVLQGTHGNPSTLGGGLRNLVRMSPRYLTREFRYIDVNAATQSKHIRMTWRPRTTHLDNPIDAFDQTIGAVNTNPPPTLAYLHFGFISEQNTVGTMDIKLVKTYYVTFGNPKQIGNTAI